MEPEKKTWLLFFLFLALSSLLLYLSGKVPSLVYLLGGGLLGGGEWYGWLWGILVLAVIIAYGAFRFTKCGVVKSSGAKIWSFDWWAELASRAYNWLFVDAMIYGVYVGVGFTLFIAFSLLGLVLGLLLRSEVFLLPVVALGWVEPMELRMAVVLVICAPIGKVICNLLHIDVEHRMREELL